MALIFGSLFATAGALEFPATVHLGPGGMRGVSLTMDIQTHAAIPHKNLHFALRNARGLRTFEA